MFQKVVYTMLTHVIVICIDLLGSLLCLFTSSLNFWMQELTICAIKLAVIRTNLMLQVTLLVRPL